MHLKSHALSAHKFIRAYSKIYCDWETLCTLRRVAFML
jgi:hypothetical protein